MAKRRDPIRIQFEFSPEAFQRLRELQNETDAASMAEVVRNSLRFLQWFLGRQKEGYRAQLVKGKEVKEIDLIF